RPLRENDLDVCFTRGRRGRRLLFHAALDEVQALQQVQLLLFRLLLAVVALCAGRILLRDPLQIGVTVRRDGGLEPLGALLPALPSLLRLLLTGRFLSRDFLFVHAVGETRDAGRGVALCAPVCAV